MITIRSAWGSLRTLIAAAGAAAVFVPGAPGHAACVSDPYIGSVCATAVDFCPRQYLPADGKSKEIATYSALFHFLQCKWGCKYEEKDGKQVATEFNLPDMRGRSPIGTGTNPGFRPVALGDAWGHETHTLTVNEMPSHTHTAMLATAESTVTVQAFDGNGASSTPSDTNNHLQTVAANPFSPATDANLYGTGTGSPVGLAGVSATVTGSVSVQHNGGSQPFSIQSPVTALTYCIAVQGVFPAKP